MRDTLSLQRTLYRSQRADIRRSLGAQSAAFRRYEATYERSSARFSEIISTDAVLSEVRQADVTLVGDYHTLPAAQAQFLELVKHARRSKRRVVLALEFAPGRQQRRVERYLRGQLSEDAFLRPLALGELWTGFRPLFAYARRYGLDIVAIDSRQHGAGALRRRDAYAANRIARALRAADRPRVLALIGQYHLAPEHLPRQLALRCPEAKQSVVFQNCEAVHWSLARRRLLHRAEAVRLESGALCLMHTSPVICQQSFLDYLEGEHRELRTAAERFHEMAGAIAHVVGLSARRAVSDVAVLTPSEPDLVERLRASGHYSRAELQRLERHWLSRESCYLPRARAAYLASGSLAHAAEEAAHAVRHTCVGARMEATRRGADAFYARCLEEALGYFGSKLVNPSRSCTPLSDWAEIFRSRRGPVREVAAFVLAHQAAQSQAPAQAARLAPFHDEQLFLAVTHALGYLLGDALFRGFEEGELSRTGLQALFRNPFDDAQATYRVLWQRFAQQEDRATNFRQLGETRRLQSG
jgi:uncharacterized iron-regulated protein